ncbi:MAG: hypothetical protein QG577_2845 [Thermodesulfobacteriota bacterium]|nr:hypothetical protein [Thermodesulfobacteriota bacterium]
MAWRHEKEDFARRILGLLYEKGMIRTCYRDKPDGWTLISGLYSPLYIQLRPIVSHPQLFALICTAMVRMIKEEAPDVTKTVGIAMAGIPLVAGMSIVGNVPATFTRKLEGVKTVEALKLAISSYGEHALLEGNLVKGDRLAIVDDLVTRFDSKQIALEQLKHEINRHGIEDVKCRTIAVVVDREQGGAEAADELGVQLLRLIPFKSLGIEMLRAAMHPTEWDIIRRYLDNPASFQEDSVRQELADLCSRK